MCKKVKEPLYNIANLFLANIFACMLDVNLDYSCKIICKNYLNNILSNDIDNLKNYKACYIRIMIKSCSRHKP